MVSNYTGERFIPGMNGSGAVEHLHRYILARQLSSELDVLDIACGEGYGSALVAEVANSVVGVDIDLGTINEALSKYKAPNLSFIQGDCANIPHPNNSFDLVISFETIEHHDKQSEMLREIRRVLRPDGVILISSPNRPEFNRGRNEPYPYHVRELDYNEFNSLLCEEFKNVEFYGQKSTFGSLVIPLHEQKSSFHVFDDDLEPGRELARPIYFIALGSNSTLPLFNASILDGHSTENVFSAAHVVRDMRAYFACDGEHCYDQTRSIGITYPLNGCRQNLELKIDANSDVKKIRLDLSNDLCAIFVHQISIHQDNGTLLWEWNGSTSFFSNTSGVILRKIHSGLLFICVNDDPQFDLNLPVDVLRNLGSSLCLSVEITPQATESVLYDVFAQDDRDFAELRADLANKSSFGMVEWARDSLSHVESFAQNLEDIECLIKHRLALRDKTIVEQTTQLDALRDELIRVEAQLDLLKDVMLGDRAADFL